MGTLGKNYYGDIDLVMIDLWIEYGEIVRNFIENNYEKHSRGNLELAKTSVNVHCDFLLLELIKI